MCVCIYGVCLTSFPEAFKDRLLTSLYLELTVSFWMLILVSISVTLQCTKRIFMFEISLECLCSFDQWVLKFAHVVAFLSLLKMVVSTRLKLFQKLTAAYTDAYKEKNGKDVQLKCLSNGKKWRRYRIWIWKLPSIREFQNLKTSVRRKKVGEVWRYGANLSVETWTRNVPVVVVLRMWMWAKYLANFSSDFHGFQGRF